MLGGLYNDQDKLILAHVNLRGVRGGNPRDKITFRGLMPYPKNKEQSARGLKPPHFCCRF